MTAPFVRKQSSPFVKRILIPFWILRVLILLIGVAVYAVTLAALIVYTDDILKLETEYNTQLALDTLKAVTGVIMGIQFVCLLLEIVCIIKRSRRTLSPGFFLWTNVAQSTFIVVMFVLSMIGARTAGGIGISVAILIVFLGFLVYAGVIFHKYRKGELKGNDAEIGLKGGQ